jgi:hypothetical protein
MCAAAGQLVDGLKKLGLTRIKGMFGAERAGQREGLGLDIDPNHPSPEGIRDHDGREADSAAPMDNNPVPGIRTALVDNGPEGSNEATPETSGRDGVELIGQADKIDIGVGKRDPLGKGTPTGETRLVVVIADMLIAGEALRAVTTTDCKGNRYPFATAPTVDLRTNLFDHTDQLVAWYMG